MTRIRNFFRAKLPLILSIYVLMQPLLDVLTAPAAEEGLVSVGVVVRTLFLLFAALYVVLLSRFEGKGAVLLYLGALAAYLLLFLVWVFALGGFALVGRNLRELVKVVFLPVAAVFLWAVWREYGHRISSKVIAVTGCLYAAVIFAAYETGTGSPSYPSGFGTKGWFYAANEVGCIIAVAAPIALCFCLSRPRKTLWMAIGLFSIAFAANYIGTKIIFLAVLGYCVAAFVWCLAKKQHRAAIMAGTTTAVVLLLFRTSPLRGYLDGVYFDLMDVSSDALAQQWQGTDGESALWLRELIRSNPLVQRVDQILSRRLYIAAPAVEVYLEHSVWGKLVGIGYANVPSYHYDISRAIELDGLSLLIRHGLLGFLLFYLPYVLVIGRIVLDFLRRPRRRLASLEYCSYLYAALMAFGISFIAGHVLGAPAVGIFTAAVTVNLLTLQTQADGQRLP